MSEKPLGRLKRDSLTVLKPSSSLVTLKYNGSFCNKFFEKSKIFSVVDDPSDTGKKNDLVYGIPKAPDSHSEMFKTIIDLLMQLRAAQSDQNVFVQNNTVVREQILNQLKSEILRVSHKLTNKEIRDLEVISSNSFDEKSLTDILKSLLNGTKKKSQYSGYLNESVPPVYRTQSTIVDEVLSRYNKNVYKTNYNEETFNRVLHHISSRRLLHRMQPSTDSEEPERIADSDNKDVIKKKKKKKSVVKKSVHKDLKNLENLYEQYGTDFVTKADLILSVIKTQVKLSETNILNKTKAFVHDVVSKNVSELVSSEVELINKSVVKDQVRELTENIVRNQEQHDYYRVRHQNEIRRISTELKKIQNLKIISNSQNYVSKAREFIDLNTQNILKKNIVKLSSGKSVIHRFETIGENVINNYISKKAVYKDKFINKLFENYNQDYERRTSYSDVNLRHRMINIDERSVKDIYHEDVLVNRINRKQTEHENFHGDFVESTEENVSKYRSDKKYLTSRFKKSKRYNVFDIQDEILSSKKLNYAVEKVVSTKYQTKLNEFLNFLRSEKINKQKVFLESVNRDNNLVFDISNREIIKKIRNKHEDFKVDIFNTLTRYDTYLDRINNIRKISANKIGNKVHTTQFSKVLKNISSIQKENSLVMNYKILPETLRFVHGPKIQNVVRKDIEIPSGDRTYFISSPSSDFHTNKSHIVYKQVPKPVEKKEEKKKDIKKEVKHKEPPPDIVIKEKPKKVNYEALDMKKIDERIMAKTLEKREIEDLIKSYMDKIDIRSISQAVMEGVERKILMDRKRNGIF